jgi:hypothetical protein
MNKHSDVIIIGTHLRAASSRQAGVGGGTSLDRLAASGKRKVLNVIAP